jgi:PD-(D/E)XK nuclease superfamily
MSKEFNITGICRPAKHYMADVSGKLAQTLKMAERGDYFIINRPRQYGKTTTLFNIEDMLLAKGDYIVFNISFEGIGDIIFNTEEAFSKGFVEILATYAKYQIPELADWLYDAAQKVHDLKGLSDVISNLTLKTDKKFVLLIDEVDKSSNNQLFISFLAMLRNKYLLQDRVKTFYSVILAGVHDVKSLKLKIRPDAEQKYNSPWNIASEFKVNMNLQVAEIIPMLTEYAHDKNVKMDTQLMAEQLFYYTSGYPFLVSKLCKMLDEEIVTNGEWTPNDVTVAVKILVNENNTNFDSLIKYLENSQELYEAVHEVAIKSDFVPFNVHIPIINLGVMLGIFVAGNGGGRTVIHNRIYNEVIGNYMTDKTRRAKLAHRTDLGFGYKNDDKTLNLEAVLLGFQTFMKKEYHKKDRDFLKKNGRLVFLAFLKPIINGNGYDFKEPQISEEKRLDLVITYLHQKFVAELKVWHGQKAHEEGIKQLSDYLDSQNLDTGYLLIFDHSEVKNWHSEWLEAHGKKIFAVWV